MWTLPWVPPARRSRNGRSLGGAGRARYLYAIARLLQKHSRLFAVLESLDNGKPIREIRDIDIPLVQRHFYYHAGMAQLMESELPDAEALGVCGQIIPWNFPLLMLAWKIAPALSMGNTVVLKPAEYTSLTALLFADICCQAGLPKGVVNIVTGDGAVGEMIVNSDVDKIAFTGSTSVGRRIREATAGSGKELTLELGGKSAYIVFDDADIDSAIEGLVDAIWFNQGQVCCAGSRLLVQEGIADRFHDKLRTRMDKLRVGDPLDKCIDMWARLWTRSSCKPSRVMVESNTAGHDPPCGLRTARERLLLSADTDLGPRNQRPADAGGNLWPGAGIVDLPHPGRGGRTGQQHPLRAGGDGVDRECEPRAGYRAQAGCGRGLGECHQPVRRCRRISAACVKAALAVKAAGKG